MKFLLGVLVGLVVLGVGAAAFAAAGLFNAAASIPPTAAETKIARFALDHSVARRAPKSSRGLPSDPEALRAGLAHYHGMCVGCHGAPGVDAAEWSEGLNPPPPDLSLGRVQKRTDGELFWIVQNGIRMSGMPAFGTSHKDEEIWKIVAFLRRLPALTPDQEKELKLPAAPEGSAGD
jgi:mono/diheme cytochrome c family protein